MPFCVDRYIDEHIINQSTYTSFLTNKVCLISMSFWLKNLIWSCALNFFLGGFKFRPLNLFPYKNSNGPLP